MWALLLSGMERAEHDCPEYADGRRCLESAQSLWCGRLGSGCFDGRLKFQRFLLKSLCLATVDSPRCFGLLCPAHSPNPNRIRAHGDTSAKLRECLGYGKANRESIAIPNVFSQEIREDEGHGAGSNSSFWLDSGPRGLSFKPGLCPGHHGGRQS